MSRRSVPRIAPADLRDHAEEARLDRVWARIDADLPAVAPVASRRPVFAYLAIAAAFTAFAGGIVVGKAAFRAPILAAEIAPVQATERTTVDVLAAGSEGRSFALPGGGQLMLQPGATVEIEHAGGDLTLKLLQGAASVDTVGTQVGAGLMIVAGEARLNTQAGSVVNVTRNQDDLDVSVSDGSVSITSPAGEKKLGRNGREDHVPLHAAVAVASPTAPPVIHGPRIAHASRPIAAHPIKSLPVAGSGWFARYEANDFDGALALLRQEPGGIPGAISSAHSAGELMAISTLARSKGGDPGAGMSALRTVVDRFPNDEQAQGAAYSLAGMLQASGKRAEATSYLDRAKNLNGPFAEAALCLRIKDELRTGHKDEAIRQANEYVAKYPDGRCKDEVELALASDDGAGGAPPVIAVPTPAVPAPAVSAAP
jgi:hypothetical protein